MEHLPMDLLIKILSSLPLLKLYQLRLVCRSWNTLLRSPELWQAWSSHQVRQAPYSAPSPWLVMVRWLEPNVTKEFLAYSCTPSSSSAASSGPPGKWLPLHHLLQSHPRDGDQSSGKKLSWHLGGPGWPRMAAPQLSNDYFSLHTCLMTASGSLMCFLLRGMPSKKRGTSPSSELVLDRGELNREGLIMEEGEEEESLLFNASSSYSLLVLNIATGEVNYVPVPPDFAGETWDMVLKLVVHPAYTGSYHILVMSSFYSCVDVYNSRSQSWRKGQPIRAAQHADVDAIRSAHAFHIDTTADARAHMFAYNLEVDTWSMLTIPLPELAYDYRYFVTKYQGRILFVSALRPQGHTNASLKGLCIPPLYHGFGVWELHSSSPSSTPPSPSPSPSPSSSSSSSPSRDVGSSGRLKQVSLPPPHFLQTSYDHSCISHHYSHNLKFIASENIICMTGVLHSGEGQYITPLVYDLASDSWYQTPSYHGRTDFLGVCALVPTFATIAS